MDGEGSGTSFPLSKMLNRFESMRDEFNHEQPGLGTMLMGAYIAQVKASIAVANALAGIRSDIDNLINRESEEKGKSGSVTSSTGASSQEASIRGGTPAAAAPSTERDFFDTGDPMDCLPRKARR